MPAMRGRWSIVCLVSLLVLAGCGPAPSGSQPAASISPAPVTQIPPSAIPLPATTAAPGADLATSPLPTHSAAREALELVVLHSNDNWGETEPCG